MTNVLPQPTIDALRTHIEGHRCRVQSVLPFGLESVDSRLPADRVIYLEARDQACILACMEEGLRNGGLGALVGEVAHLSMKASRRLMLAAQAPGSGDEMQVLYDSRRA